MNIDQEKKAGSALKTYFVKNAIPTEGQFAQLIDSGLNQRDDGMIKMAGDPLSIEAAGDPTSLKRAINLYVSFADPDPAWSVALRPRQDPADPNTGRLGLSVNDAEGNSRLCIDQETGNVGIGTTKPSDPLHVMGRIRAGALSIGPWPANPGYVFFGSNLLDQTAAGNYALLQGTGREPGRTFLNSPVGISFRIANDDRMILNNTRLDVMVEAFKPGGGPWGTRSDLRLKQNICPLQGALERLMTLRGVVYEWKEPDKQGNLIGPQIGFLAEQVEMTFPEWVGMDSSGYKTLSIRGFEALIVEALRELRAENAAFKERLSNA